MLITVLLSIYQITRILGKETNENGKCHLSCIVRQIYRNSIVSMIDGKSFNYLTTQV